MTHSDIHQEWIVVQMADEVNVETKDGSLITSLEFDEDTSERTQEIAQHIVLLHNQWWSFANAD